MEKVDVTMLGSCKKVTISKDDTVVLDGAGNKKSIEERCEQIRAAIETSTSDYDREKLEERLAKLSGGVAVLKIGGASEAEVGEKKDRVTDALNATKAAVAEGIVPGGGVALLYASRELDKLQTANYDQKIGVQIIQAALKTPVYTIASNAGMEGALIVGKLLEQDDEDLGYDAAKGEYVNMVKSGIIDPLKVIRTALVDAASVASLMTTTEAAVVDYGDDWKRVAEHVGGRTEKECVARFIKLPFGEQFVEPVDQDVEDCASYQIKGQTTGDSGSEPPAKRQHLTPLADASNPIMAQAAFLSALAGVEVSEAAQGLKSASLSDTRTLAQTLSDWFRRLEA